MAYQYNPVNGYLDANTYPNPATEEEHRTQANDLPMQALDFINDLDTKKENSTDITNNRKLSPTGNFTGTWHGLLPTQAEPGLSAKVEAHLAENAIDAHGVIPMCRVHGAQQSIATSTDTAITYNTELFDTDTIFDGANNTRLTCKTAGKYLITGHIVMNPGTGIFTIAIRLNGTTLIAQQGVPMQSIGASQSIATVFELAIGDYVELIVTQTNSTAVAVINALNRSPEFGMVKVG